MFQTLFACRLHVNMRLSLDSLVQHVRKEEVVEAYDVSELPLGAVLHQVVDGLLCKRADGELYHQMKCIDGECTLCSIHNIEDCIPRSLRKEGSPLVCVKHFEYTEVSRRDQSTAKKLDLVRKEMTMPDFFKAFKMELFAFVKHDFTNQWQSYQYKQCLDQFKVGSVVIAMDFAENHAFLFQEEIQSLHWTPHQCTVFVVVLYRHAEETVDGDGNKSTDNVRHIVKEHHFFISDDGVKDVEWVKHALDLLVIDLMKRSISVKGVTFWSDGCAAQFKSGSAFWDRARQAEAWGCNVEHHFFCSGHGKGEHDGAGANVKHAASLHNLRNKDAPLQTAKDLHRQVAHNCHQ